ncbi:MAG: DUF58 domain-containing protein [Cyanobacteria bacterium J06642_2]
MKRWRLEWERRSLVPSVSGWVLVGVGVFCFLAGTNTLSGWLFVMSGLCWALLAIAALLVRSGTRDLNVRPRPLAPCSAGSGFDLTADLSNQGDRDLRLFKVWPDVPTAVELETQAAIAALNARELQVLNLKARARERGLYRWSGWWIRTGAPLGLWWYRRWVPVMGEVIAYPQVVPLVTCPILTTMAGRAESSHLQHRSSYQDAAYGETRSLRPYRRGDALRLVHWRSSAKYGELRSRELEATAGKQPLAIAIDGSRGWQAADFEQAAIAACSIYLWGKRQQFELTLWTAAGEVKGDRQILAALAAMQPDADRTVIPDRPTLWLTWNPQSLIKLVNDAVWLGWGPGFPLDGRGVRIDPQRNLRQQLQALPGSL